MKIRTCRLADRRPVRVWHNHTTVEARNLLHNTPETRRTNRALRRNNAEDKPAKYAALGISEYQRFDYTCNLHGTKLAANCLVEGQYEPILIEGIEEGILQDQRHPRG